MILDTGRENSKLKDRLERIVRENRVSHAYIFEGPSNIDKEAFARGFIKGVLCPKDLGENCGECSICSKVDHGNHEDITYFRKDGLSVKDAAIEALQEKIKVRPVGERNIMVICDSDTMTAKEIDKLTRRLEKKVYRETGVILAGVGLYSYNTENDEAAAMQSEVRDIVLKHDWAIQLHGFYVDLDEKEMTFDVVLNFNISAKEAVQILYSELKEKYPSYDINVSPDVYVSD